MGNLLGPDPEFRDLNNDDLRVMVSSGGESVLRRGRAMMELGRWAFGDPAMLREVAKMIRAPEKRRLITVGNTSVPQLGMAGLVGHGSERRSPSPRSWRQSGSAASSRTSHS